jgi:hypothetical protein
MIHDAAQSILFFAPLDRRMQPHPPRGFPVQEQNRSSSKKKKENEKMAAYAIAYGFTVYTRKSIRFHEEEFTWIADNCYLENGDYAMFEEIIEKEF